MPRFTICPALTSAAARRTISSRDQLTSRPRAPTSVRVVRYSIDVACSRTSTMRLTKMPGQVDVVGIDRARGATSLSTSATVTSAAIAISGLKLRAVR